MTFLSRGCNHPPSRVKHPPRTDPTELRVVAILERGRDGVYQKRELAEASQIVKDVKKIIAQ